MAINDTCIITGCENIIKDGGNICGKHKARMRRNGNYNISPKWNNLKKGQLQLTKNGYFRFFKDGKRVLVHRYIMEHFLNRKLTPLEKIHHINGIKTDNRINNLKIITQSKHIKKYHKKQPLINWSKMSIPNKATRWYPHNFTKCLINSCTITPSRRGLCKKHYQSYNRDFHTRSTIGSS